VKRRFWKTATRPKRSTLRQYCQSSFRGSHLNSNSQNR